MTRFQIESAETGERWEVEVESERFFIGRSPSAEVQLPHTSISRKHLLIELKEGTYHFVDLCSTNGTLINELRRREGLLVDGDTLQIGAFALRFHVGSKKSPEFSNIRRDAPGAQPTREVAGRQTVAAESRRTVRTIVGVLILLLACVAFGVLLGLFGSVLD